MAGNDSTSFNNSREDLFDLREVLKSLSQHRILIGMTVGVTLAISVLYLHFATLKYSTTLSVVSVESSSSGIPKRLSGLASLGGINLSGNSEGQSFDLYISSLTNHQTAVKILDHKEIVQMIFANEWDEEKKVWREPTSLIKSSIVLIKKLIGTPITVWREPNSARIQEILKEKISINQEDGNPIVTISMNDSNPEFSVKLLLLVNRIADNAIKLRAKLRAENAIQYLLSNINSVANMEHKSSLVQLLKEQELLLMRASSPSSYVADIFIKPYTNFHPVSPNPALAILIGLLSGFFLGILLALLRARMLEAKE